MLERGYDKVIYVQRDFIEWAKAMAKYHRKVYTLEDYIKLSLTDNKFFINCKRNYDLLNKEIQDPKFLKITLFDWNHYTFQTFNQILDFLEFPKENRLLIAPVKLEKERDFEGYSCSHLPKEHEVCKNIEVIRQNG